MSDDTKPKPEPTASMLDAKLIFRLMVLEVLCTCVNTATVSVATSLNGITSWDQIAGPQLLVAVLLCIGATAVTLKAFFSNTLAAFKSSKERVNQELENKSP